MYKIHCLCHLLSEKRKWNAISGKKKTDLSYELLRKWPTLPPIQTFRHSNAALFQCLLPSKVLCKLEWVSLSQKKRFCQHRCWLHSLPNMGQSMNLGFSKQTAQLYFLKDVLLTSRGFGYYHLLIMIPHTYREACVARSLSSLHTLINYTSQHPCEVE